ncbi:glycerophosphodiester phosphodiesterase [Streptomyces sp. NPDC058369]|uniref:glycerophosphodiester phosphodiesterase n=1 Tax=Streptomyces sp. NPDC058369 TaxID=3346462 RepID=UPI003658BE9B
MTDLLSLSNAPIQTITADSQGMVPSFYGPNGATLVYLDFGGGRVAMTPINLATDFAAHVNASDPHGSKATAVAEINAQKGAVNGIAPLGADGKVPTSLIPPLGAQNTASIPALLAQNPFYIAHRGSGMEYPEHTMAAYEAALTGGVQAIEVSAGITADGIPVCIHDSTLDRTTTGTGPLSNVPYATLINTVQVNVSSILGQGWKPQPFATLRDVFDRFFGRVVIFLEPKSNEAVPVIQKFLQDYYPNANQYVVWKNYFSNPSFALMKSRGFTTWGYVDAGTTDAQMAAVDSNIDIWGVPANMTDARKAEVVAKGKPVICWEVHRRSQRDKLVGLGVRGMMAAQYKWLTTNYQILKHDNWVSCVKAPGDMGRIYYDGTRDMKYDGDGWVHFDVLSEAAMIGSCSIPSFPANGYRMTFDMKYDGAVPSQEHAGVAFGKPDDSPYRFSQVNDSGGYHMLLRGSGSLELYSHAPGVTSGTQLAIAASTPPVAGQVMSFQVDVTPTQVKITRTDVTPNVTVSSTNTTYRGGYVHISGGSISNLANKPRWRNLTVNAL